MKLQNSQASRWLGYSQSRYSGAMRTRFSNRVLQSHVVEKLAFGYDLPIMNMKAGCKPFRSEESRFQSASVIGRPSLYRLAGVAFLMGLGLANWAQAMNPQSCQSLFRSVDVIQQMGQLRLEILASSEAVLRIRLESEFQKKLDELSQNDPLRRRQLVLQIQTFLRLQGKAAVIDQTDPREEQKRSQKKSIARPKAQLNLILKTGVAQFESLNLDDSSHKNSTKGQFVSSAVMWSSDDRFLAIRADSVAGLPAPTEIYDFQNKNWLQFKPLMGGVISTRGHHYAEDENRQVTVTDLASGQRVGVFAGQLIGAKRYFTDQFVITSLNSIHDKDRQFRLYLHGKGQFDLGSEFGISETAGRIAFFHQGRLRIVDLMTGQDLPVPPGMDDVAPLNLDHGYFQDDSISVRVLKKAATNSTQIPVLETKILFLNDLSVYEIDSSYDGGVRPQIIGKTKVVFRKVFDNNRFLYTEAHDLETGAKLKLDGAKTSISHSQNLLLVESKNGKVSELLDAKNWGLRTVPMAGSQFAADGQFLIRHTMENGIIQNELFELATEFSSIWPTFSRFTAVAQGQAWAVADLDGSEMSWLYQSPDQAVELLPRVFVGHTRKPPGISPSGRKLVTIRDSEVVVLEYIERH